MAEELATPPADEPFEDFFKAGNAADAAKLRGEAPPQVPEPEPVPSDEPPPPELPLEEPPVEEPKKKDGRTLEGRRDKQYEQVAKATAERREAERELARINEEIAKKRAELEPPQPPQAPQQRQPRIEDLEPKIEWFAKFADGTDNPDPYTSWLIARQDWTAEVRAQGIARSMAARAEEVQEHRSWESRVDAAEQVSPGLREKLRNAKIPLDPNIRPYIRRHEQGAEIASYLVDHPDVAQRLATLHPVEQIGQIGEIVGQLKASAQAASRGSAAPARPTSQARAPIQPLGTTPAATVADPGDDEPIEQYVRRMNAADRKRGRL